MMGVATYTPMPNLQTSAFVERRSQSFLGESYGLNSYGGSVGYSRPLLEGSFNGSFVMTANTADNTGEDTLGFSTNENYTTRVSRLAHDRTVRLCAERADPADHVHELVLQLLRQRSPQLGHVQLQSWAAAAHAPH